MNRDIFSWNKIGWFMDKILVAEDFASLVKSFFLDT